MSKADEPEAIDCFFCSSLMEKSNRIETERFVRVLRHCTRCDANYWKKYTDEERSRGERRLRWH